MASVAGEKAQAARAASSVGVGIYMASGCGAADSFVVAAVITEALLVFRQRAHKYIKLVLPPPPIRVIRRGE